MWQPCPFIFQLCLILDVSCVGGHRFICCKNNVLRSIPLHKIFMTRNNKNVQLKIYRRTCFTISADSRSVADAWGMVDSGTFLKYSVPISISATVLPGVAITDWNVSAYWVWLSWSAPSLNRYPLTISNFTVYYQQTCKRMCMTLYRTPCGLLLGVRFIVSCCATQPRILY